jgi:hypothetical protein
MLWLGAATPYGVLNPVNFDNSRKWERLIIGFAFAKPGKQLAPSVLAGTVRTNAIESSGDHDCTTIQMIRNGTQNGDVSIADARTVMQATQINRPAWIRKYLRSSNILSAPYLCLV